MENDAQEITVVPSIWVDKKRNIMYYPYEKVPYYIMKWQPPKNDWLKYKVINILFEGDKEECHTFMNNYNTTAVEDSDSDRTGEFFFNCLQT